MQARRCAGSQLSKTTTTAQQHIAPGAEAIGTAVRC